MTLPPTALGGYALRAGYDLASGVVKLGLVHSHAGRSHLSDLIFQVRRRSQAKKNPCHSYANPTMDILALCEDTYFLFMSPLVHFVCENPRSDLKAGETSRLTVNAHYMWFVLYHTPDRTA